HTAKVADYARKNWHGEGFFRQTLSAVTQLVNYPGFNVIATVTRANAQYLVKIVEFFHRLGIGLIMLNPVRCTRHGGRALKPDNLQLARVFIKALERCYELYAQTGRKLVISNFANTLIAIIAPTARRLMCDISPCGGGRCFFAVSASGDVFPCSEFLGFPNFAGGNLFKKSIEDILVSPPFLAIRNRQVEVIAECRQCAIRNFCGAPCPAEVFACEGKLEAPSPYCQFYEQLIRYAFRVIEMNRLDAYLWNGWRSKTGEAFHWQSQS
ncbi:MAG: SPASM domain-containing protein, partial [Planctomycetota bacterium]|nr:SPASM domain-containing protein [Planctomycetota bacterium]